MAKSSKRRGVRRLSVSKRRSLPRAKFGLPSLRKYPIDTRRRAANAKARATQQYHRGNLTLRELQMIHSRADRVLYH